MTPTTRLQLRNSNVPCLLDAPDHDRAALHAWHLARLGNIKRSYRLNGRVRGQTLATFLLGPAPEGMCWRHANGDRMDFRRSNLVAHPRGRKQKRAQGRFIGVGPHGQRYRAVITLPGESRQTHLGLFPDMESAARSYDAALIAAGLPAVNFPLP